MYHLKLCKALSYTGVVRATKEEPDVFVEDKAIADKAVASGYFKLLVEKEAQEDIISAANEDEEGESQEATETDAIAASEDGVDYEALSKKTKAELLAYANANGIDVSKCNNKADILEAISVANGGSPTMIDLQEV